MTAWNLNARFCPRCHSTEVLRLKREGIFERVILRFTDVRPFLCRRCKLRHYRRADLGGQPRTIQNRPTAGEEA